VNETLSLSSQALETKTETLVSRSRAQDLSKMN